MFIWKEIDVGQLERNRSDLDIRKMFKCGAITIDGKYRVLEVEQGEGWVKVLARLEPGFEEYVLFDRADYDLIPEIQLQYC